MSLSYLLKSAPWQTYIRPMLLLSLGLHAFILLLPFPASQPVEPEEEPEEEAISLTQLSPSPTPAIPPSPAPTPTPRVTPPPVIRPAATPLIRPLASPVPAIAASPQVTVSPTPSSPATPTPPADPFAAEFPRYPSAQPGSFGLPANFDPFSFKTTDALSTVETWFQQQLQTRQFLIQAIEQSDQTGRAVYRIAKDGKTKYLTLIPNAEGAGTTYLLSDQPLPADLGSTPVVSVEEQQFYGDLAQIIPSANPSDPIWQEVDNPTVLPDPNAFYANLDAIDLQQGDIPEKRAGIQRSVMANGQTLQTLLSSWQANFDAYGYTIAPLSNYGGGSLYQLSRDGVTGFVSLVPTARGTAVYIWNRSPN